MPPMHGIGATTDALYIKFQDGKFKTNEEVQEGIILDIGEGDVLLGIEILEASTRFLPRDLAQVEILMPLHLARVSS
jgi:uncharacterized protein YuzE